MCHVPPELPAAEVDLPPEECCGCEPQCRNPSDELRFECKGHWKDPFAACPQTTSRRHRPSSLQGMSPGRTIRLDDGRILGWADYGDPSGRPLMYFHGWPSSRLEAEWWDAPAREEGVRVISIDRPGIGLSTHRREYRFEDWPRDVAALARALGFEGLGSVGSSGGARTALP